jgi:Protein of unknown function (DUF1569)
MKNLFEQDASTEILQRIDKFQASAQRQWGKMEVAQMLAHCTAALQVAAGQKSPPRMFIGKILGPIFKSKFYDDSVLSKNGPTDKSFIVADKRDFEKEKVLLKNLIQQFADGGIDKCTTHPHSFFGKLTAEQWGIGMYKHIDHHLRQFDA